MLKITADFSEFNRKFDELTKVAKEEPKKLMVQEARLLCVELANVTQPFGDDDKAKQQGEEALKRDYANVYRDASKIYQEIKMQDKNLAEGFWKYFKQGKWDKAQQALRDSRILSSNAPIDTFDGGTAHKQRWLRGKLKGVAASIVLKVQKGLKPYLAQELKKIGFAKGGWASCAKKLGGVRGIPQWVTRHDTPCSVIDNTDKEAFSITIRNEVNYTSQVLSASGARDALKDREIKLTERIKRILSAEFKKKAA